MSSIVIRVEKKVNISLAIDIMMIVSFLRFVCLILGMTSVAHVLYLVLYSVVIICAIYIQLFSLRLRDKRERSLAYIGVIFVAYLLYIGYRHSGFNMKAGFGNSIGISIFMIFCAYVNSYRITNKCKKIIHLYLSLLIFVSFICALLNPYYNGDNEFYFVFENPNQSGLLFLLLFLLCFCCLTLVDSKSKYINAFLFGLVFICCIRTRSWTSINCCLIALVYYNIIRKKPNLVRTIANLNLLIPLSVILIYYFFHGMLPSILEIRGDVAVFVIRRALSNPLLTNLDQHIGNFSEYYGTLINAHNGFLQILWDYSLVGLVLLLAVLIKFQKEAISHISFLTRSACAAFSCYSVCFLHLCFESALFSSSLTHTLFLILIVVFIGDSFDV